MSYSKLEGAPSAGFTETGPGPDRSRRILARIIASLADDSLGSLTYRTAASAAGGSTYRLSYNIGGKERLRNALSEVLAESAGLPALPSSGESPDEVLRGGLERACWGIPRHVVRLHLESLAHPAGDGFNPDGRRIRREAWTQEILRWLKGKGLDAWEGEALASVLLAGYHGLLQQYVHGLAPEQVLKAFDVLLERVSAIRFE